MPAELTDLQTIKYGLALGICIFIIRELLKIIWHFIKNKKQPAEAEMKETSRERIKATNDAIQEMRPAFWTNKNQCNDMHEIITAKSEGVPLIYNKGLEKSISMLNSNIGKLAITLKNFGKNCELRQRQS